MISQQESASALGDLERWMEIHGPALFLFARQQTASLADAQDAYQDGIIKVLRSQKFRKGGEIPPLGRMFLAIKHAAIDLHRQRERRKFRESMFAKDAQVETQQGWFQCGMEKREQQQRLHEVLTSLPASQQEVLILKIWGELTFRDIGEILGIPPATAATRYRTGIAEVRKKMEERV